MDTAKIFMSGRSQAVRLPKEYRFDSNEVFINRVGTTILLMPKENPWDNLKESLNLFPDDFMEDGRADIYPEERANVLQLF